MKTCLGFALCCLLVAPSLRAEEPTPRTIAELLPDNALALIQTTNIRRTFQRLRESPLGRAYFEQEFQRAIRPVQDRIAAQQAQVEQKLQLTLADVLQVVDAPVALAILELHPVPGKKEPQPDLVLMVDARNGREPCEKLLTTFTRAVQAEHPAFQPETTRLQGTLVSVYPLGELQAHVAYVAEHLVIASNVHAMNAILTTEQRPDECLEANKAFRGVHGGLPKAHELLGYLNVQRALAISAGARTEKQRLDIHNLGIDKIAALGFASTVSDKEIKDTLYVHCPEGVGGVLNLLRSEPVDAKALACAPRDAWAVAVARVDWNRIFTGIVRLMEENEPVKAFEFEEGLPHLEEMLGFNVQEELLGSMGTQVVAYSVQAGGALIPDLVLVSQLRDPLTFERCFNQLYGALADPWGLEQQVYGETVILYRPGKAICPCFAIHNDALLFSLYIPSLKRAIRQREKGFAPYRGDAAASALAEAVKDHMLFMRGDFKRVFDMAYNTLYPMARTAPREELPINWQELPAAETLSQHFGPLQLSVSHTKTSLTVEGASPVGGALPVTLALAALSGKKDETVAQAPRPEAKDKRDALEAPAEEPPATF